MRDGKMWLKADLHIHTKEDPYERVLYDSFYIIDMAAEKGFDVISITNHNLVTYNQTLVKYAEKKGILLLPGMEGRFTDKHVLIINPEFQELSRESKLEDLEKIKNNHNLIIAAHPFFPGSASLHSLLHEFIKMFDAIEFCHFYNHTINMNKKALKAASKYSIPLVGTSDSHFPFQLGSTYSLIQAEKNLDSIIKAVKNGKIKIKTKPLSLLTMTRIALNSFMANQLNISYRI